MGVQVSRRFMNDGNFRHLVQVEVHLYRVAQVMYSPEDLLEENQSSRRHLQ